MSNSQAIGADRMGTAPVGKLLFSMAVPMMLSMMVQALYNIVDSIFVAQLSENALAAVSMAFPVQNIMISIAVGIGVGVSALVSRKLGEGNREQASQIAMQGYFLSTCATAVFVVVGLLFTDAFVASQVDMNDENGVAIYEGCTAYLQVLCVFGIGIFYQCLEEKQCSATGKTVYAMVIQLTGAIVNIILDPIMIFGLLGCPEFGVVGAAYATVIGQTVSALLGLIIGITKNTDLHLKLSLMKPDLPTIGSILQISVPSILMTSIGSILTYILNVILIGFSSTAVAVYGAFFKLQSFLFMPLFGLNNGMVPIIGYNYGAKNKERVHHVVRIALTAAVCIMFAGFLVFHFAPAQLLMLFNASDEMLVIGIPALKTISLCFVFAGVGIIVSSVCQALGYATYSLVTSIARQIVVLLPCIYLLSLSGELRYIWYAWPIAEFVSLVLSLFFLQRAFHKTGLDRNKA